MPWNRHIVIGCSAIAAVSGACADREQEVLAPPAAVVGSTCGLRVNNTVQKLMECVTLDGVLAHLAAFQGIADANGGNRFAGFPGHDASVAYVVAKLAAAGYDVTVQEFDYATSWLDPAGTLLAQTSPVPTTYVFGSFADYIGMSGTPAGDETAAVTPVDLQLGLGNSSTSGCEAADFAGFPAGHIALIQRGVCNFDVKAENAAAAGAVAAIIFNQGDTPNRIDPVAGTLGSDYTGGIPVLSASYTRGVEWAATPGLVMHLVVDAFAGTQTTYNVLADSKSGDASNMVVAGAHLDSDIDGPGINNNGSGSAALLETALQMAKVKPRNKVRFAWWSATEDGTANPDGSTYYVSQLSGSELTETALYLNFDMLASPNYVRFVLDGDDSTSPVPPAPAGSAPIESFLHGLYAERGLASKDVLGSERSDWISFYLAGVPMGGLTTGSLDVKTAGEVADYGGVAGVQYDPCFRLPCDTYANVNDQVLDLNADIVASAVLSYAMNTAAVNGVGGKGNFRGRPGFGTPTVATQRSTLVDR